MAHTGAHPAYARSAGITLVEVCWATAVFAVIAAITASSFLGWRAAERHGATTAAVAALLREAQQRAVTESRTLCVSFDLSAQQYWLLRGQCGAAGPETITGPMTPAAGVRIDAAAFPDPSSTAVTFYPRGTATSGWVSITRSGSDRVDTVRVTGLTGRVSNG